MQQHLFWEPSIVRSESRPRKDLMLPIRVDRRLLGKAVRIDQEFRRYLAKGISQALRGPLLPTKAAGLKIFGDTLHDRREN
jgi:hypothetical protein